MFYVVVCGDYEIHNDIRGVFTDISKAEKCKEYELKKKEICDKEYGDYGRYVKIIERKCSDNTDFDSLIEELEDLEKKKKQAIDDLVKAKDLAEFNRIKEKYNL